MQRAFALGVKVIKWLPEEDDIIRQFYPLGGKELCKMKMPNRDASSIRARAKKLHIHYLKYFEQYWTQEEDNIIRTYYPNEGKKCVKRLHGRTEKTLQGRASAIGVTYLATMPREICNIETGEVFASISAARNKYGHIGICFALKHPNSKAGGFHWKYLENEDGKKFKNDNKKEQ